MKYVGPKSGDFAERKSYRSCNAHTEIYREPYRRYCLDLIRTTNLFLYLFRRES